MGHGSSSGLNDAFESDTPTHQFTKTLKILRWQTLDFEARAALQCCVWAGERWDPYLVLLELIALSIFPFVVEISPVVCSPFSRPDWRDCRLLKDAQIRRWNQLRFSVLSNNHAGAALVGASEGCNHYFSASPPF